MRHLRSVAYSVERVMLNKHQIWGGAPKLDCYPNMDWIDQCSPWIWWQYPQLILPQQIPAPEPTTVLSFGLSVVILRLTGIGQLKCASPKCIIRLSTEQITYRYGYLNISIKISVSQTIIGNKKLLHILKKHSSSHSRSGHGFLFRNRNPWFW